jgi:hypothetical protein
MYAIIKTSYDSDNIEFVTQPNIANEVYEQELEDAKSDEHGFGDVYGLA